MTNHFLGDAFAVLSCQFGGYCSAVWCSAADTHLKVLDSALSGASFYLGVCLSVTFLIVDMWQYCVCCIRSCVIRCTLLMVLCLDRMCHCGLQSVLRLHIGTLMRLLGAVPRSTAELLLPFQCPSGTILLTPHSMVGDWRVSRAGPMFFYWLKLLYPFYSLLLFFHFYYFCL